MSSPSKLHPALRRAVVAVLCASGLAGCAAVDVPGPSAASESAALGARVDDFLTRMSGFGYSGNVLLLRNDTVVLAKGYGLADRARQVAYTPESVFDIGSMAKQFTAAAVLKLEAAGRLALGDPLGRLLADVPGDKRGITVEQLLTHTAGIVIDFPYSDPTVQYEDVGRAEALRRVLAAPLEFEPGKGGAYSNCGYIVLAAVVETVSGVPFRQYLHDSVFAPAGLEHTMFWGDPRLQQLPRACGYDEYGTLLHDPAARSSTTWCDLGGGMVLSTLADLDRWRRALAGGSVLPAAAVERMWTPRTKELSSRDGDYGYGWFLRKTPRGTTLIQHGGDYLGTGAEFAWFRDEGVVLITSTNVRHDLYPTRNRTDRVIPKLVFGGEHPEPPAWAPDPSLLQRAVGEYSLPSGGTLVVHARGERFFLGAEGQAAVDLLMPGDDSLRQRRARLTETAQRALEGARTGDFAALAAAAGETGELSFCKAVAKEMSDLGTGPIRAITALGTFASGYPRGTPHNFENTLLRIRFAGKDVAYVIRWGGPDRIALTEVPAFTHAADTQLRADGKGGLVAWNIVYSHATRLTPRRNGSAVEALVLHAPQGDLLASRVSRPRSRQM